MNKNWKSNNLELLRFEKRICRSQGTRIAGIDEAGRGPLAGPVVAAAVILKDTSFNCKIYDSKLLSKRARLRAYIEIVEKADIGVGIVNNSLIDKMNILEATKLAITKAIATLKKAPDIALIDGIFSFEAIANPYKTVIKGDRKSFSIACASIVAKVIRDDIMSGYGSLYPDYDFENNSGYGTQSHIKTIKKIGITPIHRLTFKPVYVTI